MKDFSLSVVLSFLVAALCSCGSHSGPAPVLTPDQAIAAFRIEPGFVIELVAAEPQVEDPVAITFDEDGAMWVVEMRGYMTDENGAGEDQPIGRIKILLDLNNDGRCDSVRIFADSLIMPRAVCPVYGGVLVAEPPKLWFYEKNGTRTLVDSLYAEGGNPEHQPNGLLPAMDNWIYSAKSDRRYRKIKGKWQMEFTEFRGQWGISQDDFGRLIYNDNSTTLRGDHFLPNTLPLLCNELGDEAKKITGPQLVENRVFPPYPTPGINRGYEPGMLDKKGRLVNVTGACGPTIYNGGLFSEAYTGNAFVPEPCAQLVKRIIVKDSLGFLTGQLPYRDKEFLTSTDERFRPVNMTTAPDGSLYLVDMHRGLIQHTTYLTPFLRKHVRERQLEKPVSLGRIYRIRPTGAKTVAHTAMSGMGSDQLIGLLSDKNAWRRNKAQWLLVERADDAVVPQLQSLALEHPDPVTRLHALWTLQGLDRLREAFIDTLTRTNTHPQIDRFIIQHTTQWANIDFIHNKGQANLSIPLAAGIPRFCRTNLPEVTETLTAMALQHATDSLYAAILAAGIWQYATPAQVQELKTSFLQKGVAPKSCLISWLAKPPADPRTIQVEIAHLSKLGRELYNEGKYAYESFCAGCHGKTGEGLANLAPPLKGSGWVNTPDKSIPVRILLDGLTGPVSVGGKPFHLAASMPGLRLNQTCNDGTIAKILTFVRNSWGNKASVVTVNEVSQLRIQTKDRQKSYTPQELYPQGPEPDTAAKSNRAKLTGYRFNLHEPPKNRWKPLFNGENLEGWSQVGGTAIYQAENGRITGYSALNTPNSFLITMERYADFILELEVYVDTLLNSGIQIRSNHFTAYNNNVFHGYQIEIDPSARAWSGGIYDESRRGWLFDLKNKPEAQAAFRKNTWNKYRIEAIGPRLRTWVNDIPVAELTDSLTTCGYIGLQVHSIGQDSFKQGRQVSWRNIRLLDLGGIHWTANIETPGNPVSAIFDGRLHTSWQGRELTLHWQEKKGWNKLEIILPKDSEKNLKISVSNDGINWIPTMLKIFAEKEQQLHAHITKPGKGQFLKMEGVGQIITVNELRWME